MAVSEGDTVSPDSKEENMEEEAQNGKGVRKPEEPTKKEWEEHMLTHIPFRSWCPYCVMARGRQDAHRSKQEKEESRRRCARACVRACHPAKIKK